MIIALEIFIIEFANVTVAKIAIAAEVAAAVVANFANVVANFANVVAVILSS